MGELSPSHLAILASACDRDDGIAVRPSNLRIEDALASPNGEVHAVHAH